MGEDAKLTEYLESGGKLTAPDNAPPRYRAELMRIMASFIDSELAGAAGFADSINMGPGVTERIAASRIVLEKHDHAERVLAIMGDFGANTDRYETVHPWAARIGRDDNLGAERRDGDMRLNVFHYPIEDWTDAVAMNVLMGAATVIQIEELSHASYQPLADAFIAILPRETRHFELGVEGLAKIARRGEAGQAAISASTGYWRPRVAASFGGADSRRFSLLKRFGLRHTPNEALRRAWEANISDVLSGLTAAGRA